MTPETISPAESFEVTSRYCDDKHVTFFWRDKKHTPYNKRPRSVDSWAQLTIEDSADGNVFDYRPGAPSTPDERIGWINIALEENTTINGRSQCRTISVCLGPQSRAALLAYLQGNG